MPSPYLDQSKSALERSKSPPEYFPRRRSSALLRWRPFTTAPDTSSDKVAAPHDAEWQPPHVREMATAKGAEYTSKMAGIKAAFQGALVSDNMEEASDEEGPSDPKIEQIPGMSRPDTDGAAAEGAISPIRRLLTPIRRLTQ